MRVMMQGLSPRVQNGEKPNIRPQMLRITSDGLERFGNGLKEQIVEHTGILKCQGTELAWQGKYHMTIGHIEKITPLAFEPGRLGLPLAFWAVPMPTRIVLNHLIATVITLRMVTAKGCCAALRDGLQDAALGYRGHVSIALQVGRAIVPHDICYFKLARCRHDCVSGSESVGK